MRKGIVLLILSAFTCVYGATIPTSPQDIELLKETLLIIKSSYVKANLNDRDLIHGAIEGVVNTLGDPYTSFLSSEDFKELNNETSGQFGGVGIIVTLRNNRVTVISPIFDTPADRAGMKAGDIIISVNGQQISDGELKKALKLLKGDAGEDVEIVVYRERTDSQFTFSLVREVIQNSSIVYSGVTEGEYGYIRIRNFSASTESDLIKELKLMQESGIRGLVLDLRSNAGGLLSAGINAANIFLDKGTIISTRSRDGDKNIYLADSQVFFGGYPIAVLIDRGTASAAEIMAAALHDNHRAVLVGEKSFGKGCVQTVKSLSDGSALSLTTAWYYTPDGECIHDKGIVPDISVENPIIEDEKEVEEILAEFREDQEESYQDKYEGRIHRFVPQEYDLQLIRAVDSLNEFWNFKEIYEKISP